MPNCRSRGMIFCKSAAQVKEVVSYISEKTGWGTTLDEKEQGVRILPFHCDLDTKQQSATLDAFRDGHVPYLATTDVLCRGIDIDKLGIVVIFGSNLARRDDWMHRICRTARGGRFLSLSCRASLKGPPWRIGGVVPYLLLRCAS